EGARRTLARVLSELVDEFLPAAWILVLELHARRSERIGFGRLFHAGLLELSRRGLGFFGELLPLIRHRAVAAARHHQRTRALRVDEAEVQRREAAHGQADDMGLVDSQRVEHGTDVVARAVLRIALPIRGYFRRWIAARVEGNAPIAAGEMTKLRFPRAIVAGKFVHEDDGN